MRHRHGRTLWRLTSALALLAAGLSILLAVILFRQVRDAREASYRQQCVDINARHDRAVAELPRIYASLPLRSTQEIPSRLAVRAVLEAIVPRRDCDEYVRHLIDAPDG